MRASDLLVRLTLAALLAGAGGTCAADTKGQKAEVRHLQQEQRRLAQEKAQLERQRTDLEAQLKDAGGKLEDAKQASARASARGSALAKDLKAAEEDKAQLTSKLEATERQLTEQAEGRNKAENEGKRLAALLATQERATSTCEAKNLQLYRYGQEMARRYKNKDALDALEQSEPFTGLKRVEVENLLEEYQDKLDSEKVEPSAAAPVAGQ